MASSFFVSLKGTASVDMTMENKPWGVGISLSGQGTALFSPTPGFILRGPQPPLPPSTCLPSGGSVFPGQYFLSLSCTCPGLELTGTDLTKHVRGSRDLIP